jgi:hypothetical protein
MQSSILTCIPAGHWHRLIITEVVLIQLSSWGWAQSCSKHVEDSNKHIIKETVKMELLDLHTGRPLTSTDYNRSCINTIVILRMSTELFETCRGFNIYIYIYIYIYTATRSNSSITKYFNWRQYCNFSKAQTVGSLMIVYLNRNMQEHLL